MQSFIPKHGLNTGKVNEQQTSMTEAWHRVILRASVDRRSANNIQQGQDKERESRETAIIQMRGKQSPKG